MSSASYCRPLAARDVETTSEVKEGKDYGSGSSVAEVDPPRQRSPTVNSISGRSDNEYKVTESSQRIDAWALGESIWDPPWSPLTQYHSADTRDDERSGNYNHSGVSRSTVTTQISSPSQHLGPVTRTSSHSPQSSHSPRSKEPSLSIEAPKTLREVLFGRIKGRHTHISSSKRVKDAKGTQERVRACVRCQARRIRVISLP